MGSTALAAGLVVSLPAFGGEGQVVDFSRDVLPILSANCFVCHGRDASTRKAKLRLDLREQATARRGSPALTPIVPGQPEVS